MDSVRLRQHFYASGDRGFASMAFTPGLRREEQSILEDRSLYQLPMSLLYSDNPPTLVKYVFHKIGEHQFAVGRGTYKGRDRLGRPGNYLFHNFIVSKEDLLKLHLNPSLLTRFLEAKHLFKDTVSEGESCDVIELATTEVEEMVPRPFTLDKVLILTILQACCNIDTLQKSILLRGNADEIIDFLCWLFSLVPYSLRESLSYDTQSFGLGPRNKIVGLPDDPEFAQSGSFVLTLNLASRQYQGSFDVGATTSAIGAIAEIASMNGGVEIENMHSAQHSLVKGDYTGFKEKYGKAPSISKDLIFANNRWTMVTQIAANSDTELLLSLEDRLTPEDIAVVSPNLDLMRLLVDTGHRRTIEVIAAWFLTPENKENFLPLLFESRFLWEAFLEEVKRSPKQASVLVGLSRVFPHFYSIRLECELLETLVALLPDIKLTTDQAQELVQALVAFPPPEMEGIRSLRAYVVFRLIGNDLALAELLKADISLLPREDYSRILRGALERIVAASGDRVTALLALFAQTKDKLLFACQLLDVLEVSTVPARTRQGLREVTLTLVAALPPGELTETIRIRAGRLFPSPQTSKLGTIRRLLGPKTKDGAN